MTHGLKVGGTVTLCVISKLEWLGTVNGGIFYDTWIFITSLVIFSLIEFTSSLKGEQVKPCPSSRFSPTGNWQWSFVVQKQLVNHVWSFLFLFTITFY